jgi:hypothetical protein
MVFSLSSTWAIFSESAEVTGNAVTDLHQHCSNRPA